MLHALAQQEMKKGKNGTKHFFTFSNSVEGATEKWNK
jgi:hypothetical protein